MSRKIIALFVTVLLLFACPCTVLAEEFDEEQLGAISVTLTDQKQNTPIVGAELSVYYVATVVMTDDGTLIYDYTEDFKQLDTAIDDGALVTKLDDFVSKNNLSSIKITTNAQGTAMCDELSLGLYFIKQEGAVDGFAPCKPFVVTVPNQNDGEYIYEVNATPKTEVERLVSITIKKVWNIDPAAKAPESVTVQLLKDGTLIKTATLNAENNWQITYGNMQESDAYSIKEVSVPKGFTATYTQEGYVFTVTNTSSLAQTGQLKWPIPVLAVGGMLLIAVGVLLLVKKRKVNG